MPRKSITNIIEKIIKLLKKQNELSIRQISLKLNSQWRTIAKALETMKSLEVVQERKNQKTKRKERLFSLVKK